MLNTKVICINMTDGETFLANQDCSMKNLQEYLERQCRWNVEEGTF